MEGDRRVLGFSTLNSETIVVARINGQKRTFRLSDARRCLTQELLSFLETKLEWEDDSPQPRRETPSPPRSPKAVKNNETPRCSRARPKPTRPPRHGFDRGLEPRKVLGATRVDGKLLLLVQWNLCDDADLLPATEVYSRCPQKALDFYLERVKFAN